MKYIAFLKPTFWKIFSSSVLFIFAIILFLVVLSIQSAHDIPWGEGFIVPIPTHIASYFENSNDLGIRYALSVLVFNAILYCFFVYLVVCVVINIVHTIKSCKRRKAL